jgi:hypothetical protein
MANDLHEALARFNVLPDDAVLPSQIAAILLGVSERTVRYHPHLPRVQISRVVGELGNSHVSLCRSARDADFSFNPFDEVAVINEVLLGGDQVAADVNQVLRRFANARPYSGCLPTQIRGEVGVYHRIVERDWRNI